MDSHNCDLFTASITYVKSTSNLLVVTLGIDSSNTCGAEETVLARRSEKDITTSELTFSNTIKLKATTMKSFTVLFQKVMKNGSSQWDKCTSMFKNLFKALINHQKGLFNLANSPHVVAQLYPWFKFCFPLFLGVVMYDNEFETKENKI